MKLPEFFASIQMLVGEDEPSNAIPSLDHGTDELPFNSLGGRRFEILGYLLELEDADEEVIVTLVQAAGDKGRDLLVHRNGVLARIIQCKNLIKKLGRPDLLVELVKLLLFNEVETFLPESALLYEIWAPRGLTDEADALIAEWPNGLETSDVLAAFQKVTATYKTLDHFRWDQIGASLVDRLKAQFRLKQENGITLSQRVRRTITVYQQFFKGVIVMPQPDVDLYLDKKLAPKVAEIMRLQDDSAVGQVGNAIDAEIDEAAGYINSDRLHAAASLLSRLKEKREPEFTVRQLYRVEANLGAALFRLGNAEEAAAHFLKAATLLPEDERASTNEVFAHFLLGHDAKAHELASSRRGKFPGSGRLLAIWITTAPKNTDLAELKGAVPDALSADPEVNVALARKLLEAGRAQEALMLARQAQQAAPNWAQSHLMCAHCAIAFNLLPPGVQKASSLNRTQVTDEGILAASRAHELAKTLSDEHTESQAFAARCELYLFAGNDRAAVEDAKRAFMLNPKDVGNVLTLAQTQLVENKIEAAIATLEQALELEPRPDVSLMLSQALTARGNKADRRRSVELLEGLNLLDLPVGMRPPLAISFVQGLSLLEEWDRASAYLEVARDAVDEATWQALSAFVLKGMGHSQDAEGRASESLASLASTTHSSAREFLARILMTQGRFADALPVYEELFQSGTPAFDPMQLLECASRLNRDELVLDIIDELHRRKSVDWRLLEIELHYLHQYHALKAIDRLNAFLERNPEHKLARLHRSAIAWEIGLNDLVVSKLQDLPTVEELPLSYIRITLKMISLGPDRNEAVDYAYRFLKLHFDKAEAHAAMIVSVLGLPHEREEDPNLPMVVADAAVGYRELPEGALRWTVLVETDAPDANFEERSIDDALSKELLGKKVGERFVLAPGLQDRMGEIVQILPKQVRRFQDSLAEIAVRFPSESGNFQSVRLGKPDEIDLGMATLFESVRRRAEQVKELQELYRNQPIPVHLYARRFATNAYEAMLHLADAETVQIKCCGGDAAVLERAVQSFDEAKCIILDLSSVATFRLLGLEDQLSPESFVISHDSIVELRETLVNDVPDQRGGTMVFKDGRYALYEEEKERKKLRLEADRAFFEKVRAGTTIQPTLSVASLHAEQRETLFNFLGKYGFETVVLAVEPESVLLTDDLVQGDLAAANFGVHRSWTHAFLIHLRRKGKISQERFVDAVAKLIGMQYINTPFDSPELSACARLAKYDPTAWPFARAAESFAVPQNSIVMLLRIALGFFLQLVRLPVVPQNAGRLLGALLEKMWSNPEWQPYLLAFRKNSQRIFGLNVPAEHAFNEAFDGWRRNRESGLL
jgi:tetratricopeptide (TPR) repeat protein